MRHHAGYEHGVSGVSLPRTRIPTPPTKPPLSTLPPLRPGWSLIENQDNTLEAASQLTQLLTDIEEIRNSQS